MYGKKKSVKHNLHKSSKNTSLNDGDRQVLDHSLQHQPQPLASNKDSNIDISKKNKTPDTFSFG